MIPHPNPSFWPRGNICCCCLGCCFFAFRHHLLANPHPRSVSLFCTTVHPIPLLYRSFLAYPNSFFSPIFSFLLDKFVDASSIVMLHAVLATRCVKLRASRPFPSVWRLFSYSVTDLLVKHIKLRPILTQPVFPSVLKYSRDPRIPF